MDRSDSKFLLKLFFDFVLLALVLTPIGVLFFTIEPYKRGFFCNDNSLLHPYREDTISMLMLLSVCLSLPIATILIIEIFRGQSKQSKLQLCKWNVPLSTQKSFKYISYFIFGLGCCQVTTDIGKYSIGRLRPHFLSVCQPEIGDSDCENSLNWHRYIEEYTCSNVDATEKMLKEMRLSFPSGHASFSFYTMMFCIFYLHFRLSWKASKLFKPTLQFLLFLIALYTSLSRISDYKHHWSDVLSGAVIGIVFAVIVYRLTKILGNDERSGQHISI